ncbi:MAG TPA: peptidase domain-containing ABC transporter, partial [Gemmataceae bacterium]|nr:peptidase domain-containing ABC transporter [Gemmataceae bacterium]
ELAGTDRVGTNLLGLVKAAEKLGFSARAVKGPYEALPEVPLPAVVHVKTEQGLGHFVVLYRVRKKSVVVADPARGVEKLSRDEFCKRWSGYLVVLVPDRNRPVRLPGSRPVGPARRFLGLLMPHSPLLVEASFCALLMTVLGVAGSFFIQHLVDSVLVRGEWRLLNALGAGMVVLALFKALFGLLRQYLLSHVSRQVDLALMSGYGRHLLALPLRFYEMRRVGEILSRFHDAGKVREAISGTTTAVLVDGVMVTIMAVVLWLYDAPLALVASAFVPLLVGCVLLHQPFLLRRSRDAMEQGALLSAHLVENVSGAETIKAFGVERARTEEADTYLVRVVQSVFGMQKIGMSMGTLGLVVTGLAGVAVLWYGGHRVIGGALTIGQLMFFTSLLGNLLGPLERLAGLNVQIQDALIAVDRLYQVLDLDAEAAADAKKLRFDGVRDGIELKDVAFRYGCRANVLEGLSLTLPAGKTVGIVGGSGSGKSTLLKLLQGFYGPTGGRILIDGVDMRDFELSSLRAGIGVVSQEAFIFNATIRDNIAVGRPDASLEEVMGAARAAGLEEFIGGLPERYETVIGERGANLSGGQRQRLAIARALLRRPSLLIFDEATSSLDTATERAIQQSLKTALAGKTVVMVAHRLSTIKDADRIYVLQGGGVLEEGTHQELMAKRGEYAALWRAQSDNPAPSVPAMPAPAAPATPSVSQEVEILTLYMEGRSEREIAERLGIPERRARRLLERLRGLVDQRGFPGLFRSLGGSKAPAARAEPAAAPPPAVPVAQRSIYDCQLSN